MTATQTAPLDQVVEGKGTLAPAELVKGLTAVLPHSAEPKVNLPAITGVKVEATAGKMTLAATDRYSLGTYTLDWDGGDVDAFLPFASAKELLAYAKAVPKSMQTYAGMSLTFDARQVEVFDFTRRSTLPVEDPAVFPRWRGVLPSYEDALPDGIQYAGINPAQLQKFAKAQERGLPMTMIFGGSPNKPIRVELGDQFVGLIMPVRLPQPPPAAKTA